MTARHNKQKSLAHTTHCTYMLKYLALSYTIACAYIHVVNRLHGQDLAEYCWMQ